ARGFDTGRAQDARCARASEAPRKARARGAPRKALRERHAVGPSQVAEHSDAAARRREAGRRAAGRPGRRRAVARGCRAGATGLMNEGRRLSEAVSRSPLGRVHGVWYRSVDGEVFRGFYDAKNPMRPLWGLGAPRGGARFTPRNGPSSLYLAEDVETAQREGL